MYAKLAFNASTTLGLRVRDVIRLITESATGNASLSNLETIDVANSELIAGVNSGWTLAAGQTLPAAGTAVAEADAAYILEGTCVNSSKKKYMSIHGNGAWPTVYNSTVGAMVAGPVLGYGTANQYTCHGSTQSNYFKTYGIGFPGQVMHIFATPRKLIILGPKDLTQQSSYGSHSLFASLEFKENYTTSSNNLSPTVWFHMGSGYSQVYDAGWQRTYNDYYRYGNNTPHIMFPESYYDWDAKKKALLAFAFEYATSVGNSNDSWSDLYYIGSDGSRTAKSTGAGSTTPPWREYGFNGIFGYGGYSTPSAHQALYSKINSSTGAYEVSLEPLSMRIDNGYGFVDMSISGIFRGPGYQIGALEGDNLSANGDNYYHWVSGATSSAWALYIKKE